MCSDISTVALPTCTIIEGIKEDGVFKDEEISLETCTNLEV